MPGASIGPLNLMARVDSSMVGQDLDKTLKQINVKGSLMRLNPALGAFGLPGISKGFAKQFAREGAGLFGESTFGAMGGLAAGAASFLGPLGLAATMAIGAGKFIVSQASKGAQDDLAASWKDFKGNFKIKGEDLFDMPVKGVTMGMDRMTAMNRWRDAEGAMLNPLERVRRRLSYFFPTGDYVDAEIDKYNPANTRGMFKPANWEQTDFEGYSDKLTMAALDLLKDQDENTSDTAKDQHEKQKDHDRKKEANKRGLRGL